MFCSESFINFDASCRYEIVSDMVEKFCGGGGNSDTLRKTAIRTVGAITFAHAQEMSEFTMCLEQALDYVSVMDLADFRRVMNVLSFLAYSPSNQRNDERFQVGNCSTPESLVR